MDILRMLARFQPFYEAEGGGGGGADDNVPLNDELRKSDPDRYWRLHWKKESGAAASFATRDEIKQKLRDLEGRALTPEQQKEYADLRAQQSAMAEDKKRAEGKFDELKTELVTKHSTELTTRDSRIGELETLIADREIDLAFANAIVDKAPLFGGDDALTIFPPDIAAKALRDHVAVEHLDINGRKAVFVRVKNPVTGKVILGSDGNPAPFATAMAECISLLPSKDRILRGSGKTGSGSPGGGNALGKDADLETVTRAAARGDKKAIAQLKERSANGSIVKGSAWESRPA